jgi:hypothetical protein
LDFETYGEERERFREQVLALKASRRIHVGPFLTFLFENAQTIRYQVQEMMRVERIVREADILHELGTYNELLGGPGELGATLLIEIEDAAERTEKLARWLDLPRHLYAELPDQTRVRPRFDARQVGEQRLSSVHYLIFDTRGVAPVALGADHPELTLRQPLTEAQRAALDEDLRSDSV